MHHSNVFIYIKSILQNKRILTYRPNSTTDTKDEVSFIPVFIINVIMGHSKIELQRKKNVTTGINYFVVSAIINYLR